MAAARARSSSVMRMAWGIATVGVPGRNRPDAFHASEPGPRHRGEQQEAGVFACESVPHSPPQRAVLAVRGQREPSPVGEPRAGNLQRVERKPLGRPSHGLGEGRGHERDVILLTQEDDALLGKRQEHRLQQRGVEQRMLEVPALGLADDDGHEGMAGSINRTRILADRASFLHREATAAFPPPEEDTMKWSTGRRSDNVVDARGGGMGLPIAGGGIGMVVLALVVYLLGGDPSVVTNLPTNQARPRMRRGPRSPARPTRPRSSSASSSPTPRTRGTRSSRRTAGTIPEPQLVLFSGAVQSGCGLAQAAMGPFYCPQRPARVHRPRLLPPAARQVRRGRRFRAGLRDRARGRPPRADRPRRVRPGDGRAAAVAGAAAPTRSPCAWSCRRTASPACGRTTPTPRARSSSRGTSRRR